MGSLQYPSRIFIGFLLGMNRIPVGCIHDTYRTIVGSFIGCLELPIGFL